MKKTLLSTILLLTALTGGAQNRLVHDNTNVMTAERKLSLAERVIESYYLDDVDADKLAEEAIKAMLLTLDPHSTYSDPQETTEMTSNLGGNFSGIGIQFSMVNDTLVVIQPTASGPSEQVGILPGDRILRADGDDISGAGKKNSDIIKILRGPKGSVVNLDVLRRGVDGPIAFRVVRDDIPLNSIDAFYMADPQTGYIRLSRFAETSDDEFKEAVKALRRQGMEQLIIDLTDNGGGYLGTATQLASHFLGKNDLITYTESPKMGTNPFTADKNGDLMDLPVAIMVNQYSASASEIFSGAMQDHDRGVVVGRRTFGKGLVQRPFPFPDGSMIKLTVSRYHTPSGRSIQKPYEPGHSEDYRSDLTRRFDSGELQDPSAITFPDSLRFATLRHGRTVYGGGGIMPDVYIPLDTVPFTPYYRDIVAKGLINTYSLNYVNDNRSKLKTQYPGEKDFLDGFEVTPAMLDQLIALATKEDIKFDNDEWRLCRPVVVANLKGLIGRNLYDSSAYFKVVNPAVNPIYSEALSILNDKKRYNQLLK